MTSKFVLCFLGATAALCPAAIIGTNPPALPLTAGRIATLPANQQRPWEKYLQHSQRQWQADQAAFLKELKKYHVKESVLPPRSGSGSRLSLRAERAWYG